MFNKKINASKAEYYYKILKKIKANRKLPQPGEDYRRGILYNTQKNANEDIIKKIEDLADKVEMGKKTMDKTSERVEGKKEEQKKTNPMI